MEVKVIKELSFSTEEEKALEVVYDIIDSACDAREGESCEDCPLDKNCPICNGNRIQAMKNFIRKIAG